MFAYICLLLDVALICTNTYYILIPLSGLETYIKLPKPTVKNHVRTVKRQSILSRLGNKEEIVKWPMDTNGRFQVWPVFLTWSTSLLWLNTPGHFDIPFYQLSLVLQTTKLIVSTSKTYQKTWYLYLQQAAYWNDLGFETPVPAESDSFDWGAADIEKALRSFLEAGGVLRWECRHGWWLKPLTTSNVGYRKPRVNPVKKCKGLDQLPGNYLSTGAGFQPSTVQLLDMSTECTVCECMLIVFATWYLYLQVSHHELNLLH